MSNSLLVSNLWDWVHVQTRMLFINIEMWSLAISKRDATRIRHIAETRHGWDFGKFHWITNNCVNGVQVILNKLMPHFNQPFLPHSNLQSPRGLMSQLERSWERDFMLLIPGREAEPGEVVALRWETPKISDRRKSPAYRVWLEVWGTMTPTRTRN